MPCRGHRWLSFLIVSVVSTAVSATFGEPRKGQVSQDTHVWNGQNWEPCNCNGKSDKCFFDEELWRKTGHGGHCSDCADNTAGANCEKCKPNYYLRDDGLCFPCNCNPDGSRNLQCNNLGECMCLPGVGGPKCDRCLSNYYEFTKDIGCKPCTCVVAGSVTDAPACDVRNGHCNCKENVDGSDCDRCKHGYFSMSEENDFGCVKCFCYGHSDVCRSAPGYTKTTIESAFIRDKERWKVIDSYNNEVPFQHNVIIQNIAAHGTGRDTLYFLAPKSYLGNQRASYNQFLSFSFRLGEDHPRPTVEDIIIEGGGLRLTQPIFGQSNPLPSLQAQQYKFRLHESERYGWSPRVSAQDFIGVLSNLTAIKIRANYYPEGTGFLDDVHLDTAHRSPFGMEATWIEHCTCPHGYVGDFCESCSPGFRHDPPGGGPFAECIACNCHGHADYCDEETGRCICEDNTSGDNCERCAPGYYGDATKGFQDDCKPCPCPNQGACVILPDNQVACLQCPTGYAGHKCDLCVDGYFGDPYANNNYGSSRPCTKCKCNDNIDPNAIGNCNTTTGECLKCIYNTAGRHCEHCLTDYWGDALATQKEKGCKSCNCYPLGTRPDLFGSRTTCNETTGHCKCQENVEGLECNTCRDGYFNITRGDGCEPCNCNKDGSLDVTCDILSGQCKCREGVIGRQCDMCLPYHYGFSREGCKECNCDQIGSKSLQCSPDGQCECQDNVEGRTCNRCKENKYSREQGCIDCPPCYGLVQEAVSEHREKLAELADLLEEIEKNPQIVDDLDFEKKLKEVMDRVIMLLEDAERAANSGDNLVDQLNDLRNRIEEVRDTAGKITEKGKEAEAISKWGQGNITKAEETIRAAQEALTTAKKYLDIEGQAALKLAKERSEKVGQQSERMSQIAREARQLADKQEEEAEMIRQTAVEALNVSSEAFKLARDAIDSQKSIRNEVNMMKDKLAETTEKMRHTKDLAGDAKKKAVKAYEESMDLYQTANGIQIPDVDYLKMKMEAQSLTEEAKKIAADSNKLQDDHKDILENVAKEKSEAEDLLNEANRQVQITDELLVDVDASRAKGKAAVEKGEMILAEAKKTLKTLQEFDELVKQSKDKATDAMDKRDEIEGMIDDAEKKTREAEFALSGALQDAVIARDTAKEANRIAEQASRDADGIRSEADKTKDRAGDLRGQANKLSSNVGDTAMKMSDYENQADNDRALAKEALERANQAKNSATDASNKVKDALGTVDDVLDVLDNLDDIDTVLLSTLEQKIARAEKMLEDANLDERMSGLRTERENQAQWMKDYAKEIAELEKDVKNIAAIRDSLPEGCFRRQVLEP